MWITEILSIMAEFGINLEILDNFTIIRERGNYYMSWNEPNSDDTTYIKITPIENAEKIIYKLYIGENYHYLASKEIYKA